MLANVRHQHILSRLGEQGTVSTTELHADLGVTAMTIWRDLKMLEELGLLCRVHGGARSSHAAPGEPVFELKNTAASMAKQRIAAFTAAKFIHEGDTIALEGGTSVASLIEYLPTQRISVLTNSLPVATRLRAVRPELPVAMAGGWLSSVSGNTTGSETLRAMEKWEASICFISASAFDAEVGPSDPNPFEIEAKRMIVSRARRTVMLLDSSKFNQRSTAVTLHPRRLDALVTDKRPPIAIATLLKSNQVRLCIAPPISDSLSRSFS
jgi:DeoR/GlpR family transcriptional regulator of sugar metabolism